MAFFVSGFTCTLRGTNYRLSLSLSLCLPLTVSLSLSLSITLSLNENQKGGKRQTAAHVRDGTRHTGYLCLLAIRRRYLLSVSTSRGTISSCLGGCVVGTLLQPMLAVLRPLNVGTLLRLDSGLIGPTIRAWADSGWGTRDNRICRVCVTLSCPHPSFFIYCSLSFSLFFFLGLSLSRFLSVYLCLSFSISSYLCNRVEV
jgi:hypothetical protein